MKKLFLAAAMTAMAVFAFADDAPKAEEKKEEVQLDENIQNIRLASELAEYGYANDSASALLQAAEILAQTPTQKKDDVKVTKEGTSVENPDKATKEFTAESLVADAKKLAGKDKNLLAWAKQVEKKAKTSTRGATGGVQYAEDFLYPNGGTGVIDWYFDGGRYAEIYVGSLDGADLDLYVYDQNGNLIVYDERTYADAYVSFNPRWTGVFRIIVKNNARYNAAFRMCTN